MNNTAWVMRLVLYSVIAVLLLLVIYKLKMLIVSLILATMLAAAIAPVAEALERRKVPRAITVISVYLGALLLYAVIAISLMPAIHEQGLKLYESFPLYVASLGKWYQNVLNLAGNHQEITISAEDLHGIINRLFRQTLDMTAGIIGLIMGGILILFLAAFFVVEANRIWSALLKWVPPEARERCLALILPLEQRIGGYIRGQLLVSVGVGLIIIAGLSLIGIKYALLLGLLAAVLNFVPYVGSLSVTGFAAIIAFNEAPILALVTLAFFAVEQWIESTILVPTLLGRHVELHPLVVLLAILAGASLMGIAGALISVPVVSVGLFLAEEFYLKSMSRKENTRPEVV